jgi:hypothetical protein
MRSTTRGSGVSGFRGQQVVVKIEQPGRCSKTHGNSVAKVLTGGWMKEPARRVLAAAQRDLDRVLDLFPGRT